MSKKLISKFLFSIVFVVAAIVWILYEIMPENFGNFNPTWLLSLVPGALGVLYIFKGLFAKNIGAIKKFYIFVGTILIVGAIFAIAGAFIEDNLVLPIIALAITIAVMLSVLAVGGKAWDEGDNQKLGYKNYRQRKAEEEKNKQD